MKNRNLLKFFNYFAQEQRNLFLCESKLTFKKPQGGLSAGAERMSASEKKELRSKIEQQNKQIEAHEKTAEEFKKQLDKFFVNKKTFEVKSISDIDKFILDTLMNALPKGIKLGDLTLKFIEPLKRNLQYALESNKAELKKHEPLKVTVNPGGVIDFADSKNKRILTLDLKIDSFYAASIDNLRKNIASLRERINGKKEAVVSRTREQHTNYGKNLDLKGKFGNLHEAIKNSPKLKGKVKVVQNGDFQVVKFLGKNKAERRKNELALKIEDIYNLSLVNSYPDSVLRIQVTNPYRGTYKATYNPQRGSFYVDGTTERAKIYNNGKIKVLEFKVVPKKPKSTKTAMSGVKPAESKAVQEKAKQEAAEQRDFEKDQTKDYLFDKYYKFIFKKERFGGHKLLQSKEDFKNWDRLSHVLAPILAQPPFNIRTSSEQKKYMELVIQGTGFWDPNWEIQGKDFFKYGGIQYKGGYDKFIEDYEKLTKKYDKLEKEGKTLSEKELEQLTKLEDIAVGIARVYEALQTMKPLKAEQESEKERLDRTVLLNVPKANENELKEVKSNKYLNYYLPLLTHDKEKSSHQVNILVGYSTNKKLVDLVQKAINSIPKGMIKDEVLWQYKMNPTKLLFLTFGFDTLVAKGAIKKIDDKRFVLTQTPTNANWAIAALKMQGASKQPESMQSWEKVRGKVDAHHKATNFIKAIFGDKETSVKNNLRSGWSRLWHWEWADKKYVSMENLTQVKTYGKNDFNLEAVEKRGYLDMKGKVSERAGETGMYRIPEKNHGALIKMTNDYLAKGIQMTLANAPKGKRNEILRNLTKKFGINIEFGDDDGKNAADIVKLIGVKGLNTSELTPDKIKFIRLGFLEERYLKAVESKDMTDEYFSASPEIRKIQDKLYKQGMALTELPKVEADIHAGLIALVKSKEVVGPGGFASFTLRYKALNGHELYTTVGIGGLQAGLTVYAALGAKVKLSETWDLYMDVGAAAGKGGVSGGGAIRIETGFTPKSASRFGLGIGAGASMGGVGISLMAYWRYDTDKALANQINEAMKKFEDIEKEPNWEKKVELIRKHPHPAMKQLVAYADGLFKASNKECPAKVLYFLYQRAKGKIENAVRLDQKLPAIKGVGFGVGLTPVGIGGGLYVTFQVPWTEEVVAVRSPIRGFDRYTMEKEAETELSKKLKAHVTLVQEFELKGENAFLYQDSQLGGKGLARIGVLQSSQMEELSADSSFEQIKKLMAKLNIDAKLVPRDAKDKSKGYYIQITPLDIEGGNVEIQIDPELRSKGLILDNQSTPQRILLTASAVKALMVTRKRIKFPFQSQGALNLDIITFKTDTDRHTPELREESVQYIYKRQGERYQVVDGENSRRIPKDLRNVMTLAEFRGSSRKFEKFDNVQLINYKRYKEATDNMDSALRVLSSKEFDLTPGNTPHLRKFTREWYDLNQTYFLRKIIDMRKPESEDRIKTMLFKKLMKDYEVYRANLPGTKPLSQYEQNMLYAMLLDRSFLKIAKNPSKNMPKEKIERALDIRKSLFRKYLQTYINKWIAKYPNEWNEIKKADPSITPTAVANLIALAMPKDYAHMKEMLQEPTQITRDMKFLSYTQKLGSESMPSAYGSASPEPIRKNFFKMFGVTRFNLSSNLDKRKQAVARVILNLLSPLKMSELKDNKERVEFLDSELPLMLISLYDKSKGISPMIEVLGMENFENITKLYSALRKEKDPKKAAELLNNSAIKKSFDGFREMVLKVRNAQLSGKNSADYKGFTFHFDTEVMAGPYLKCANGTMAVRQRFRITTKKSLHVPWTGAKAERAVVVKGRYKKEAAYLTLAAGFFYRPEVKKGYTPPSRHDEPEKGYTPPSRH